ncbi:hypothetical protein HHK36_006548 [Tetracentron sinense]|uniref:Calumenin n=1 Tax=Tetracentron sinense TaxID=13715 RepID=A0A835DP97_TETSI|nr:hypothetical protein HHK36_006548 [Tetracentron sinense]
MGKASVIIYITVAVFLLFLISHSPKEPPNHRHRRLKLRSTFPFSAGDKHHESVAFDPLVADIERHREDKEWEKRYFEHTHKEFVEAPGAESQPEWEDFMNAEDYLNDQDRFNVTNRLVLLFPRLDLDPVDGFVSESELTDWNLRQAETQVMHRTERDMELHDKNHDGFVSFTEYEPPSWARNLGLSCKAPQLSRFMVYPTVDTRTVQIEVIIVLRVTVLSINTEGPGTPSSSPEFLHPVTLPEFLLTDDLLFWFSSLLQLCLPLLPKSSFGLLLFSRFPLSSKDEATRSEAVGMEISPGEEPERSWSKSMAASLVDTSGFVSAPEKKEHHPKTPNSMSDVAFFSYSTRVVANPY